MMMKTDNPCTILTTDNTSSLPKPCCRIPSTVDVEFPPIPCRGLPSENSLLSPCNLVTPDRPSYICMSCPRQTRFIYVLRFLRNIIKNRIISLFPSKPTHYTKNGVPIKSSIVEFAILIDIS
ncbi:hypothetical protein V6Z11_D11G204100 [Gossypium hirsutum]